MTRIYIGEFTFGALDRGLFDGFITVKTQSERGRYYQKYIGNLLKTPWSVGAGWFQYMDQALTGRFSDGECANMGFVSVTDRPYYELIKAARKINLNIYKIRGGYKDVYSTG